MNAQTIVREHRSQLLRLRSHADRDLYALLAQLQGVSGVEVRDTLIDVLPELVAPYSVASGELSAVMFEDLRAEAGRRGVFYAETAGTLPSADRISKTSRWAVEPLFKEGLESTVDSRLTGAVAKMIMMASRETMEANASRERIGFQRMPRPGACAFCGLMASRGADYYTRAAAESPSHDDCKCVVMPVYSNTEMGALAGAERRKFDRMYQQALTDEDGNVLSSPDAILANWRQVHGTD